MKKLKSKHTGHLDWVSIIPGDWHLMKLTSEVLRDLLWDVGLKELAYECGYKKQPTQWQENNILLIATYIALLRKAVCVYCSTTQKDITSLMFYPSAFWKWLDLVRSTTNAKKRPQKLSTFSTTATPAREQKRRVNELENIAKNAMQILQEHGITAQTSPYPLAIADIHGQMRQAKKREFVNVIKKYFPNAFSTHCPLLDHPTNTLSVIHDLLYYIHMPPSFGVDTFEDYSSSLWDRTVTIHVNMFTS